MKFLFKINPKKYIFWSFFIQLMLFGLAFIIILKLGYLQIIQGADLKKRAGINRQLGKGVSFRGEIFDRNGVRLAGDTTIYDIYAHPQYYLDDKGPKVMAPILAKHLHQPESKLLDKLSNYEYSTISIAKNVDIDTVEKKLKPEIALKKIRGLDFVKKSKRVYPQENLASHILGYMNFDAKIAAGVESTGHTNLASLPEIRPVEYDGRGNMIYDFNTDPAKVTEPLKGGKLVLTIDSAIQHIAEIELAKMATKTKSDRGVVIVLNPKNGEILGFAVYPSYNPNKYNSYHLSIIKNWALSDVYPPGSTFKILTVASALETGAITENERVDDTGKIKIQGWEIKNHDYHKDPNPGIIDLVTLFRQSSNVGSIKIAFKMPPYEHHKMLTLFGLGSKTGIDLPGESSGILPEADKWDKITQASISYGYSVAATPVQIASAVAAIANDGVWVTPHVIQRPSDDPSIKRIQILSPETCKTMTRLLAKSIETSDSTVGQIPKYRVAGKTGTSKKPNSSGKGYSDSGNYTSFIGYYPVKAPKVLIMVVLDNPKAGSSWGSTTAGPVFNAVATEVGRILDLEPDKPES
jgi:cell division protein FtsI (penicillin-binding protein 3)